MVLVVDYGMGNVGSILNILKKIGVRASASKSPEKLKEAKLILLPGVGAFDAGMNNLKSAGLIDVLNEQVLVKKTPVLGICLGMQLLTGGSEEGKEPGLGWIPGRAHRFRFDSDSPRKVPHMGWNVVTSQETNPAARVLQTQLEDRRFYFVHSYQVVAEREEDVLARTPYGLDFVSAIARDNVMGVQFHPEKSHRYGMELFRNILAYYL